MTLGLQPQGGVGEAQVQSLFSLTLAPQVVTQMIEIKLGLTGPQFSYIIRPPHTESRG